MKSTDGKFYNTDVMTTEQILRLIQSIPSKKAEPFKLWLAQVGKERIDEAYDPEIAINRALDIYRKKVSQIVTSKKVLKFQQKS
jgi:hypothetical protein